MRTNVELIMVVHACGHVRDYEPNADTSDEMRERIAASESTRKCSECIAKDAQAKDKR